MFKTGNVYTFDTIAPITLNNYVNVKNIGAVVFDIAVAFEDVVGINQKVEEEIGRPIEGLETSQFYIFEGENKEKIILSELWIVIDSIKQVQSLDLLIKVKNVEETDKYVIQNLLRKAGYLNVEITES